MANTKITPHVLDSTLISGHSTVTAATNDFVLIQDVSDSNALKKALVSDLAQNEESPTFTGNVTVENNLSSDTTSTPDTVLTLSTKYASTGTNGAAGAGTRLEFKIPDDETNPITGVAIAGIKEVADDSDASAGMAFYVSQNDTTLDEAVRIDHDGKVGIGTTSPDYPVEIEAGNITTGLPQFTVKGKDNDLTGIGLVAYGSNGSHRNWGIAANQSVAGALNIGYTANATDAPSTGNITSALLINSSGNVGIGTTSPAGTLHVQMTHTSTDVTAANSNETLVLGNAGTGNGVYNAIKFGGNQQDMYIMSFNNSTQANRRMGFFLGSVAGDAVADERLSITGNGTILGATTSPPSYPGTFTSVRTGNSSTTTQNTWGFNAYSGGNAIDFGFKTSGSGSYAVGVINHNETTWMSRLDYSGAIHLTNTTVQNISDRRLKKDIVDANSQWDDIKALQFKNYKWKDEARGTGTYLGLIADEVESVSPGLVGIDAISAETMPEDGIDPEYKNVKYSIVWMKAVKALQEAMAKIETLEAKVAELEG